MTDDDLFSYALARSTDPGTSHAAAASLDESLPQLERLVMEALQRAGTRGATLDELMEATGLDKVTVSPRLRPLCNKNRVVQTEARRLGRAGRQQIVWRIA